MDATELYLNLLARTAKFYSSLSEDEKDITSRRVDDIAEIDVATVANIGIVTLNLISEGEITIGKITRDTAKEPDVV